VELPEAYRILRVPVTADEAMIERAFGTQRELVQQQIDAAADLEELEAAHARRRRLEMALNAARTHLEEDADPVRGKQPARLRRELILGAIALCVLLGVAAFLYFGRDSAPAQTAAAVASKDPAPSAAPAARRITLVEPTAANSERSMRVKWQVPTHDTGSTKGTLRLERSLNDGVNWETLASYDADQDPGEYIDSALKPGSEAQYRTVLSSAAGEQASSVSAGRTVPEPPGNFVAQLQRDGFIKLSWAGVAPGGCRLMLRSGTGEREVTAQEAQKQEATEPTLAPGTSRQFSLWLKTPDGKNSRAVTASVLAPPAAPTGVRVASSGPTACEIVWDRVPSGVKSVEVLRSENGAPYKSIERVEPTAAHYVDSTVARGRTYSYQVAALNAAGASEPSRATEAVAMILPKPEAPALAIRQSGPTGTVQITVLTPARDLDGIKSVVVERATTPDGPYAPVQELRGPVKPQEVLTDAQLIPGKEYFYRAVATAEDYDTPFTSPLESVVVKKQNAGRPVLTKPISGTAVSAPPLTAGR
jgi:hypothetical protein